MFDSKIFNDVRTAFIGAHNGVVFVFYDRFTKNFGPLNVANSIDEVVYNACNFLKSVEEKNISLEHIDVYVCGFANVEKFEYDFSKPILFFNAADYKDAYNIVLTEV